jgi:CheY-like chemotaxis protein
MAQPLLLLVDDSAEVAFIVGHLCRRAGMQVVPRADAELAWAYLQETRPDLVLVDIHLPGADGCQFCRMLRSTPGMADLPVALLSQWQRPEDIAAGLSAGADLMLSKDLLCRPAEWQRRLGEILAWIPGRRPPVSLRWQGTWTDVRPLAEKFDRLLHGWVAGRLGVEVLPVLLNRALERAQQPSSRWLAGDMLGLDIERLTREASVEALRAVIAAFAEQLWFMVGTVDSAPFREALAAAPAMIECSSTS